MKGEEETLTDVEGRINEIGAIQLSRASCTHCFVGCCQKARKAIGDELRTTRIFGHSSETIDQNNNLLVIDRLADSSK